MHSATLQGVLQQLRKLTDPCRGRELGDGDLLERFRRGREEAAFTLLVQRHGSMVLNACRRILGDDHDAEDAFQATFLVLVRKAGTIRKETSLSSWLHVVATHIAHKARAQSAR
jgi:RNA polymerase sigma-70 factor (ECF subfamily)